MYYRRTPFCSPFQFMRSKTSWYPSFRLLSGKSVYGGGGRIRTSEVYDVRFTV